MSIERKVAIITGAYAHAAAGELDGKRTRHRVERALGQRGERRWHASDRLVDQGGRDRDNVARALPQHLGSGSLRNVESAGDVDRQVVVERGRRVLA